VLITKQRREEIQAKARYLNLELWNNRASIWKSNVPSSPMEAVNPSVALDYLGFDVLTTSTNGECWNDGVRSEPVGIIDFVEKTVQVSCRFNRQQQRFTLAHELGHAVLKHSLDRMHRDMPLNEYSATYKGIAEQEADIFASAFLMPEKPLRKMFEDTFRTERFTLNENSAFLLCSTSLCKVQKKLRTKRDVSSLLAKSISYGRPIEPLKDSFDVSAMAMAIRLEELGLVV
jgi:hypothetical protein